MDRTETVEFMNLCMVVRGNQVLVQDRKKPDWPGVTFPGGHVEQGESFADAVIREVREETGLSISSPRLCGVKDWCEGGLRVVVLLYRADRFTRTLRASEEGEVWWEDIKNLPGLPLATADMMDMLRVFTEDELSEFFYRQDGERWVYDLK